MGREVPFHFSGGEKYQKKLHSFLQFNSSFMTKVFWQWTTLLLKTEENVQLGPVRTWRQRCVFFCCHVRTVTLMTMQPISDDMVTMSKSVLLSPSANRPLFIEIILFQMLCLSPIYVVNYSRIKLWLKNVCIRFLPDIQYSEEEFSLYSESSLCLDGYPLYVIECW